MSALSLPGWYDLIERFHTRPVQCVLAVTGGGASAIGDLLSVPGGSNTILEAAVPYSTASLNAWLGRPPEQYCCEDTALVMASVAWKRARRLSAQAPSAGSTCVGLGCTASLVSSRPKRGPHRAHVAIQSDDQTISLSIDFVKGRRDRQGEERVVGQAIVQLLAELAGIDPSLIPPADLRPDEPVRRNGQRADPLLVDLLAHRRSIVWSMPDGRLTADMPARPAGLLCGSFHPLHAGHTELRAAAERRLNAPVWYELSVDNVDKPPLDYLTIDRRRRQFSTEPLALTDAPTFASKSRMFPGMVFVVGADTAERIVQPRYYGCESALKEALTEIRSRGCRFLTAARLAGDRVCELHDLALPGEFAGLFEELPASEFRRDISATEIRRGARTDDG